LAAQPESVKNEERALASREEKKQRMQKLRSSGVMRSIPPNAQKSGLPEDQQGGN
jgi:hypothetical protein